MLPKLKHAFTALLCFVGSSCTPVGKAAPTNTAQMPSKERWAAYYDKQLPADMFDGYALVVFDRMYHPELAPLKGKTTLLAYISFGEVHGDTEDHRFLDQQKALIGNRTTWNSYAVDITSPNWHRILFAQIENAMEQGFDGIMLDTVDSAIHMADMQSQEKGEKAQEAAVKLISDIRLRWPNIQIMMNRGFDVLPRVAPLINYALGESTLTDTDVSTGQSSVLPPKTYQSMTAKLLKAKAIAPKLKLYTLDYWNQDDVAGLQTLYAIHRAHGFIPYVTTPDLRRFTPEPSEPIRTATHHLSDREVEAKHA